MLLSKTKSVQSTKHQGYFGTFTILDPFLFLSFVLFLQNQTQQIIPTFLEKLNTKPPSPVSPQPPKHHQTRCLARFKEKKLELMRLRAQEFSDAFGTFFSHSSHYFNLGKVK